MSDDKNITDEIKERARKIKLIVTDVDGVMTAGMIVYDSNGLEIKHFSAHDGLGIKMAKVVGIKSGIISARESGTIRKRAAEVEIDYLYLGRFKKLAAFKELLRESRMHPEQCCYVGDDLPDVPVLKQAGLAVAVANASDLTKNFAHYVTQRSGGEGAVREVVELILNSQGKLETAIQKMWEE